jgi:hypothetical protein
VPTVKAPTVNRSPGGTGRARVDAMSGTFHALIGASLTGMCAAGWAPQLIARPRAGRQTLAG